MRILGQDGVAHATLHETIARPCHDLRIGEIAIQQILGIVFQSVLF